MSSNHHCEAALSQMALIGQFLSDSGAMKVDMEPVVDLVGSVISGEQHVSQDLRYH